MEADDTVIAWAKENRKGIDLEVSVPQWTTGWLPEWFDFKTSIKVDGKKFSGRGTDRNKSVALAKALSESVERSSAYHNGLRSTNGVATHTSSICASRNSMLEVLERHLVLKHFNSRIEFEPLDETELFLADDVRQAITKARSFGMSVDFYRSRGTEAHKLVVCLVNGLLFSGSRFGIVFGSACGGQTSGTAERAFIEAWRNVTWVLETKPKPLSFEDFYKIREHRPIHHRLLALNSNYWDQIKPLFPVTFKHKRENLNETGRLISKKLKLPVAIADCPLEVFVSSFESGIRDGLRWGQNIWGLEAISSSSTPHPIG